MAKRLKILRAVVGVLMLAVAGVIVYAALSGPDLDTESKAWVKDNVPPVLDDWSAEELVKRASDEFLKVAPREKVEELMRVASQKLGKVKTIGEPEGSAGTRFHFFRKTVTAQYAVPVKFANENGQVLIGAIKKDSGWQFFQFTINSPALLRAAD